jgi:hypothetical protein
MSRHSVFYEQHDLTSGKLNAKVAPFSPLASLSLLFSAHIIPSRDSMILLEIYNPNPISSEECVVTLGIALETNPFPGSRF